MNKKSNTRRRAPITGGSDAAINPEGLCLDCTLHVMERLIEKARREYEIFDQRHKALGELIANQEFGEDVLLVMTEGNAALERISTCCKEIESMATIVKNRCLAGSKAGSALEEKVRRTDGPHLRG